MPNVNASFYIIILDYTSLRIHFPPPNEKQNLFTSPNQFAYLSIEDNSNDDVFPLLSDNSPIVVTQNTISKLVTREPCQKSPYTDLNKKGKRYYTIYSKIHYLA